MDPRDSRLSQRGVLRSGRTSAPCAFPQGLSADPMARSRVCSSADGLLARLQEVCGNRTYRQIARDTGNHPETVRRYVNGRSTPSVEFVGAICQVYGYSADWLVCGRGKKRYSNSRGGSLAAASVEQLCEALAKRVEMREKGASRAVSELLSKLVSSKLKGRTSSGR